MSAFKQALGAACLTPEEHMDGLLQEPLVRELGAIIDELMSEAIGLKAKVDALEQRVEDLTASAPASSLAERRTP